MNLELVKKIADAVLYEGYMLYPYRASAVKNRQRFNFGVLTPESYSEAQRGTERWQMQTECLIDGGENSEIDIKVRFLHLTERVIHKLDEESGEFQPVDSMNIDGKFFQTWQEAIEREAEITGIKLSELNNEPKHLDFSFPANEETEELKNEDSEIVGKIVRVQEEIKGRIEASSSKIQVSDKQTAFKITVKVLNTTPFENAVQKSRDEALAHSLASAHTVLLAKNGEFVSLLEPPDEFCEAVGNCENIGTYPILVGENGDERDCFLSSPIILYDYPEIAPESPGDLFDGAEIDEILTLRIMTMTDEEKREMVGVDEKSKQILERTENITAEQLMQMHGILRKPRAFENQKDKSDAAGGQK